MGSRMSEGMPKTCGKSLVWLVHEAERRATPHDIRKNFEVKI